MPCPPVLDVPTIDEVRSLIAKGWTPPPEHLEPYRHLLRPFYDAKGWANSGKGKLDEVDVSNLVALLAVFERFGIAIPGPAEERVEEAPWVMVLRAYVAENDGFTTDEAVKAVGFEDISTGKGAVVDVLETMGLTSVAMGNDWTRRWTKRKAA